jgi:hypothetical protein
MVPHKKTCKQCSHHFSGVHIVSAEGLLVIVQQGGIGSCRHLLEVGEV